MQHCCIVTAGLSWRRAHGQGKNAKIKLTCENAEFYNGASVASDAIMVTLTG
jgi:hypothetical protein